MRIRRLKFSLPEDVGLQNIDQFAEIAEDLKLMLNGVGKTSGAFEACLKDFRALARRKNKEKFCERIKNGRDIRAVIHLWLTEPSVLTLMPISEDILKQFGVARKSLSLLALYELTQLFMIQFDKVDQGPLVYFSKLIIKEFKKLQGRHLIEGLENLKENSNWLMSTKGPFRVAEYAKEYELDFDVAIDELGLPKDIGGRYIELSKNHYYIETIASLDPVHDENHSILKDIVSPSVKESRYREDLWLGHAVVRAMIDNVVEHNVTIPQNWLQIILSITGDPRVPAQSPRFARWWARIGEPYISHMRGWLSRFDFRLFLEILDEYAKRSNDSDLKRMFPPRERFLEGLYDLDLIQNTRLFISTNAERYLRQNYKRDELPNYATVRDGNKSIIYLNVGGMHIVEGTHVFAIRIYDKLPRGNPLTDYDVRSRTPADLSTKLTKKYIDEFGESSNMPERIPHHPNIAWQHKVLKCLAEFNVDVNPEKVFTYSDYRTYRKEFGIRNWSR